MPKVFIALALLGGLAAADELNPEIAAVLATIEEYVAAVNAMDAGAERALLALDDPRFREIREYSEAPLDSADVEEILAWVESHEGQDFNVVYSGIEVFILGDGVAYATADTRLDTPESSTVGRVTLILLEDEPGRWRIVHGHWSASPAQG